MRYHILTILLIFPMLACGEVESPRDLKDLVSAIAQLRQKSIPQAYFILLSPDVPILNWFAPDAQGGAFIILDKEWDLGNGQTMDAEAIKKEFTKENSRMGSPPTIDERRRKLVFYSDVAWVQLLKATRAYVVSEEKISGIMKANRMKPIATGRLVLEIPQGDPTAFLKKLIEEGWGIPITKFGYEVGWN